MLAGTREGVQRYSRGGAPARALRLSLRPIPDRLRMVTCRFRCEPAQRGRHLLGGRGGTQPCSSRLPARRDLESRFVAGSRSAWRHLPPAEKVATGYFSLSGCGAPQIREPSTVSGAGDALLAKRRKREGG